MAFEKLVNGFRVFKANYIAGNSSELFEKLVTEGQAPATLVIACSDSRIDPAILTNAAPGDLFSVRNVAALVPAFDEDGHAHGTSAAIQYAVTALKVKHIIVLGHALCGGMRALADSDDTLHTNTDLISSWIKIAAKARDSVREKMHDLNKEEQIKYLEQSAILVSMQNLLSFPSVRAAVETGQLDIHGWYFDMPNGKLLSYDGDSLRFRSVLSDNAPTPAVASSSCGCADTLLSLKDFLNTAREQIVTTAEAPIKKTRKRTMTRWLRRMGYALAAAAGAAIGASAEEFSAIFVTITQSLNS